MSQNNNTEPQKKNDGWYTALGCLFIIGILAFGIGLTKAVVEAITNPSPAHNSNAGCTDRYSYRDPSTGEKRTERLCYDPEDKSFYNK